MSPRRLGTLSAAFIALATSAAPAQQSTTRDSASIRIVTSAAPSLSAAQALRIDPAPQLVIGTQPGAEYEFSRVAGAARLDDGRIIIADGGSLQLRVYDARGTFISAFGGRGGGPGEFEGMGSLSRLRGDTIAMSGGRGTVTYFDRNSTYLWKVNYYAPPPVQLPQGFREVLAAFADGSTVVGSISNPAPRARGTRWTQTFPVALVDRRNATIRAFGDVPIGIAVMDDYPRPAWFSPPLSFANNDDAFFIGLGTEYSINVHSRDGKLTRIIRRKWTPVRVTKADIDTYVVEWGKRWIKSTGAEAEKERADLRDDPYAETVPAFSRFLADRVGRLWVRTPNLADAPAAGQLNDSPLVASLWSVFDRDGVWLCDITLPARFQPFDIGADYVAGISRDHDGVQTFTQYRLRGTQAR